MLKNDLNGEISMVVECALTSNGKNRRKYWIRKRFIKQSVEYKDFIMREHQSFRVNISLGEIFEFQNSFFLTNDKQTNQHHSRCHISLCINKTLLLLNYEIMFNQSLPSTLDVLN